MFRGRFRGSSQRACVKAHVSACLYLHLSCNPSSVFVRVRICAQAHTLERAPVRVCVSVQICVCLL